MIKMILADDEPVITKGIRKLIDWEQMGIQIIGEYEDGKTAFEAIIRDRPEIALLDISMPGMSGVDIIRECHGLQCGTHIIFISGFQEFEYAKAALDYGAADYLLKPVIREELLKAVEKCVKTPKQPEVTYKGTLDFSGKEGDKEQIYLPVCAYPVFCHGENEQIRKLIGFSLLSFLEEYFEEHRDGIVFRKENRIVVVLQGSSSENVSEELNLIKEGAKKATGYRILFILGDEIHSMQEIPEMFRKCVQQEGYLFFADQMKYSVISWKESPFPDRMKLQSTDELQNEIAEGILSHQQEIISDGMDSFRRMVCQLSNGRKEDALFYYCTLIQSLEEILLRKGAKATFPMRQDLLESGRACGSFSEMEQVFKKVIEDAYNDLGKSLTQNDKKDINKALEYIEHHYAENLSLNVLAEEVHMNSYYFSSFFKKSTGENFKDYVNRIRLKHAVSLLLDTDEKVYEIAMNVGFGDARAFNDAFQKAYGETPAGYRKRLKST